MSEEQTYQIKNGEPSPRGSSKPKLPLNTLEIGQYIFVPGMNIHQACSMVAYANRNRIGCIRKKYECRSIVEKGVKGVGIYRIAHPVFDAPENQEALYGKKTD